MVGGSSGHPSIETDPYFANVVSLLHFNTGTTTITDVTGKTWTAVGNASENGAAKYGAYALACDGTGDEVYSADSADWHVSNGDWTLEFFVKLNAAGQTSHSTLVNQSNNFGPTPFGWGLIAVHPATYSIRFFSSSNQTSWNIADQVVIGTATSGQWHFVSACRVGTSIYLHFDGAYVTTVNVGTTTYPDRAHRLSLMGGNYSQTYINGLMDEFRLTKGVGRYSDTNYPVPTAAFPDA